MMLPRNDRWYASLFRPRPGQIAGDINPYLAHMDAARVRHIGSLMPAAKIVYLIRNPIDRLWSELGMALRDRGHNGLERVDFDFLEGQLTEASNTPLSAYLHNLRVWGAVYPREQILVGFFDRLRGDAAGLLRDIYDFIGISSGDAFIPATVGAKSNASRSPAVPPRFQRLLADLFMPQLEELHAHFDNRYTAAWLEGARLVRAP
jgi:hypothetical protein